MAAAYDLTTRWTMPGPYTTSVDSTGSAVRRSDHRMEADRPRSQFAHQPL